MPGSFSTIVPRSVIGASRGLVGRHGEPSSRLSQCFEASRSRARGVWQAFESDWRSFSERISNGWTDWLEPDAIIV